MNTSQDTTKKNSYPAGRRDQDPSIVHQIAGSSPGGRTRNLERKASPDKTTSRKRTRVSELVEHSTSSGKERRGRSKVEENENGLLKEYKKIRNIFNISDTCSEASSDDLSTVSSHGQDKEGLSFGHFETTPADTVRVSSSDPSEGCRKNRTRNQDLVVEIDEDEEEDQRAKFEALYQEQHHLGEGGCGSVYAGYRKTDYLPVALKHISKDSVYYQNMGKNKQQCTEVSIMLKLHARSSGAVGSSSPIALLDWFDLSLEIILVLERPLPSKDLLHYIWDNGAPLKEDEAKIILKQLINAVIHLEDISIFHRDIKMENILIDTSSDVPRLRLIDFGLSCVGERTSCYKHYHGTPAHTPPEWYSRRTYSSGPTTVWQVGAVLYDILHRPKRFHTIAFLRKQLKFSKSLSKYCKEFLRKCVTKIPERRPTLNELRRHPWLRKTHKTTQKNPHLVQ